jgi:class 3 adenylate cyclase
VIAEWAAGVALVALAGVIGLCLRQRARLGELQSRLAVAARDLQRLQQSCARFAPASVVDRLLTDGAEVPPEHKEITALFADVVAYTSLAERLEAPVLARVLNGYYQRMSDAIALHSGHVSTFIGDGILAYFGAFEPNPWQSDDAVRAALAMRRALADYNRELQKDGLPPLAIGIGLHRGTVLAGLVGTRERMEYACIGRTVNVASRVQALTRTHDADILLTGTVRERLDPSFTLVPRPATPIKGIAEPIVTFAVV